MVWDFFERHQGMVRHGGLDGTIVGLDYVQMLTLGDAYDIPRRVLAELLPACEAGLLEALAAEAGAFRERQVKEAAQPAGERA